MFEASPAEAADYIHEQLKELAQIAQGCDLESVARLIQMAALEVGFTPATGALSATDRRL